MLLFAACTETLDAGFNRPHGPLPVDQTNPVILYQDDWSGDWLGEYAVLLANNGGPPLADIIINASKTWGDLGINTSGWNDLVKAARDSGLQNIPERHVERGRRLEDAGQRSDRFDHPQQLPRGPAHPRCLEQAEPA